MANLLSSIYVVDSIHDPESSVRDTVYTRSTGDSRLLYKVWLYLDGPSLPFVNKVTYHLHPTFPRPVQTIVRTPSNPNCKFTIWTWGIFTVRAVVEDKQGGLTEVEHYLTYDRELREPGLKKRKA